MLFILLYLGIALACVHSDGLTCYSTKLKFRWFGSLCLNLFWPITIPFCIFGIVSSQKKEGI